MERTLAQNGSEIQGVEIVTTLAFLFFFSSVLVSVIVFMAGLVLEVLDWCNGLVAKILQVLLLISSMVAFGSVLSIVVLAGLAVF